MIKVLSNQKGNNLLEFLPKCLWYYESNITVDYEINNTNGILFLSLRFHCAKPEYIFKRIKKVGKDYKLKILLILIDVKNYDLYLEELFNISNANDYTLILSFNNEEAARYIHSIDLNCNRSFESIRGKKEDSEAYIDFLSSFPKINKTDSKMLCKKFGDLQSLFSGDEKVIEGINGMGKLKAETFKRYLEMDFN